MHYYVYSEQVDHEILNDSGSEFKQHSVWSMSFVFYEQLQIRVDTVLTTGLATATIRNRVASLFPCSLSSSPSSRPHFGRDSSAF